MDNSCAPGVTSVWKPARSGWHPVSQSIHWETSGSRMQATTASWNTPCQNRNSEHATSRRHANCGMFCLNCEITGRLRKSVWRLSVRRQTSQRLFDALDRLNDGSDQVPDGAEVTCIDDCHRIIRTKRQICFGDQTCR